jgi:SAM-dependent methyltransferase
VSELDRWREGLAAWAIPDAILDAAPESPWGLPPELFRRRADAAVGNEPSVLTARALEALPEGGTVVDVGVGGGATSLPLASRASRITGVDGSDAMLASFAEAGREAGVEAAGIHGTWPDVAGEVAAADVVVCGHVLYNVPDLAPFAEALTAHARRRVVVEITGTHPLAWMADLWMRFHGLERPREPTADHAEAALRELELEVGREDREAEPRSGGFERREDAVALVRCRLCLGSGRDDEIAEALGNRLAERRGLWSAGPTAQRIVTMWWAGAPSSPTG